MTRKLESVVEERDNLPPQFARTPSEALQFYMDLVETSRRAAKMADVDPTFVARASNVALWYAIGTPRDRVDWFAQLADLPIFFWTKETTQLVCAASRSYPLEAEEAVSYAEFVQRQNQPGRPLPGYIPRQKNGLCVFSSPELFVDINGRDIALSALMWTVAVSSVHNEVWLTLRGIDWLPPFASPVFWSDGGSKNDIHRHDRKASPVKMKDPNNTFPAEVLTLCKWVCSAAMFIEQDIIGTDPVQAERHTRKRATATLEHVPTLKVVSLRRVLREDTHSDGEIGQVDWACRWTVRGHWRRQFFPKRNTHAPIWIHPHVKGPEDKPFKEQRETIFAVRR